MADISCVGIITADTLVKPVDALPERGLLSKVENIQLSVGGCAANAAIDLAKLGVSASICAKIGRDSFGRFVSEEIRRANVGAAGLKESATAQTSASVVAVGSDGERSVMHCFGANAEFCLDDIDIEQLAESKILFVSGAFLMPALDGRDTATLLKKARERGVLCCLDTAWDPAGKWMATLGQCMPQLDWFMPSYEEAAKLSGEEAPERMAARFHKLGAANVVIKLGGDGCYVSTQGGERFHAPAYQGIAVVDTSGAGDSFCAGFLAGLAQGWAISKCARFANAVGAHCVMALGTTAGIRKMAETLDFMDSFPNNRKEARI